MRIVRIAFLSSLSMVVASGCDGVKDFLKGMPDCKSLPDDQFKKGTACTCGPKEKKSIENGTASAIMMEHCCKVYSELPQCGMGDNAGGKPGGLPSTSACTMSSLADNVAPAISLEVLTERGFGFPRPCEPILIRLTYVNYSDRVVKSAASSGLQVRVLVTEDPLTGDPNAPFTPIEFNDAGWPDLIACDQKVLEFKVSNGIRPPSGDRGTFYVDVMGAPNQPPLKSRVIVEPSIIYDPPSLCQ